MSNVNNLTDNEIHGIYNLFRKYWEANRPEPTWRELEGDERKEELKKFGILVKQTYKDACTFVKRNINSEIDYLVEMEEIRNIPSNEITPEERAHRFRETSDKRIESFIW